MTYTIWTTGNNVRVVFSVGSDPTPAQMDIINSVTTHMSSQYGVVDVEFTNG